MDQQNVYVQQDWTEEALITDGFVSCRPIKRITMMRMLSPEKTLPDVVEDEEVIITPKTVYWMAYSVGSALAPTLDDYDPRLIEARTFAETYRYWDEPDWHPTAAEAHLGRLGCLPYYKTANVWAKQLTAETWVQSKGSAQPVLAPVGAWLCVNMHGEPRSETDDWFHAHYLLPKQRNPARN
jgi:hypothetical protein